MAFNLNFNTKDVEDPNDIPDGVYAVKIKKTETVDGKKTAGSKVLRISYEILSGKHQGKGILQTLNVRHPNEETVKIAMQQLRRIVVAMGKESVVNDVDLIGGKLTVTTKRDASDYIKVVKCEPSGVLGTVVGSVTPTVTTTAGSTGRFASRNKPAAGASAESAPAVDTNPPSEPNVADDDIPY